MHKSTLYRILKHALFTALIAAPAFSQADQEMIPPKTELQRPITIIEAPHDYDLNPHTASFTSEAQLFTALHEGLFSYDPVSLEPLNALCASYKISRDKKRWTFNLRKDGKFSDGTSINAQNVKDSWIRLLSTPNAPFAGLMDFVQGAKDFRNGKISPEEVGITIRDEYTLVVHLTEPASHFANILCHHAFSVVSENPKVYSGPFTLEEEKNPAGFILRKNPNYYDKDKILVPEIRISFSQDTEENSWAFNNGSADWIASYADAEKILNKKNVHVNAEFGTTFLFFKPLNSPWDKPEFRNALLEALPFEDLRKIYAVKAETLVYPLAGYPGVAGIKDGDPLDAEYLLKKAKEQYGMNPEEKIPLVIAIANSDYAKEWAQALCNAWEPLGIDVIIQSTPEDRYHYSIPQWNADIFSYSWIGDFASPLAFLELFRGDSSLNVSGFKNQEYDRLLLEASRADTTAECYKLLSKAEQILLDQGIIIPLYHPVSLHVINLNLIGGWYSNALDLHPYKYFYIKEEPKSQIPNIV